MAEGQSTKQSATISFTLPISCQICLGKVKEPTVCPNQHVFCSACMEMWLQHNDHCPTCRTSITPDNPCKPVIGGISQCETNARPMSTASMRKARFDVLYQDYENELQRLEAQLALLHSQNHTLQKQLETDPRRQVDASPSKKENSPKGKSSKKAREFDALMSLTNKLQQATETYEAIKSDMDTLKKRNAKLEQDNENLKLENQKLRQELAGRSPQKFGRYTVAAQQSKLEQYEREIKQLKRALKSSDDYIDQLEGELAKYKNPHQHNNSKSRDLFTSRSSRDGEGSSLSGRDRNSSASSGVSSLSMENSHHDVSEVVDPGQSGQMQLIEGNVFARKQNDSVETLHPRAVTSPRDSFTTDNSLNLELPTPLTPASFLGRLSLDRSSGQVTSTPQDQNFLSSEESSADNSRSSSRRRLNFGADSKMRLSTRSRIQGQGDTQPTMMYQKTYHIPDDSFQLEKPSDLDCSSGLDITVTSDLEDCTRLMAEATQRVEQRRLESSESDQSTASKPSDSMDCALRSDLYHFSGNQMNFSGSTALSMSQLQMSAPWPNRPGSAPGTMLDVDKTHSNQTHSSLSSYPEIRRPSSAPSVTELSCNSVSLVSAGSNIWKPLSNPNPDSSRANPTTGSSTAYAMTATEPNNHLPVSRPTWQPPLPHRAFNGTAHGFEFPQFSTSNQQPVFGTLLQARALGLGTTTHTRPIGRMSHHPPSTTSVVPQPLRAMHHLQEMQAVATAVQIPSAGSLATERSLDSRKRKPENEVSCSNLSNNLHEQPGSYSPSKTFKLF
ncbi:ORC ubiquitin ligase 1-like [Ptychodera flava]|uniref:ORC ubiquitin ligase 1-like n=1 Tax=Ptychodera flava TaxID=63121 RepID=UPI003969E613